MSGPVKIEKSVPSEYFVELYQRNRDPWNFSGSSYEAAKYETTLRMLPRRRYGDACELACSIGVFTAMLASCCERLLAVDVSEVALAAARARCANSRNVSFARVDLLKTFPCGPFDLVSVCEIGYYFDRCAFIRLRDSIAAQCRAGADVVLVHWTPETPGHALGADEVHELFLQDPRFQPLVHHDAPTYRLDVVRRRDLQELHRAV